MFSGLGRLVVRFRWVVIAAWVLAAVAAGAFAPKLASTADQSAFLPKSYESIKAMELQEKAFPNNETPAAFLVFARADDGKLTDADEGKVKQIVADLNAAKVNHVLGIATEGPIKSQDPAKDRIVQIAGAQMPKVTSATDKTQTDAVKDLRTKLQDKVKGTDLKAGITGSAAQQLDSQESGDKALMIIGVATVVLILVLLLVIFRSPIIALLPIITIGFVSVVANGLIATLAKAFDLKIDSSATQMLPIVLYGIGTDYILFLMFRYRERLRAGEDPKSAIVQGVTRVGEAIASSAAVVAIAFLALVLSSLGMFRGMGVALAIAVVCAVVAGLTFIPAVVSLLGTKVFWPSKSWQREPTGARFAAVGNALGKRPAVFALVSGGVMAVLAVFALGFHPTFDLASGSTSKTAESEVWQQELEKGYPKGATLPSQVLLRSDTDAPLSDAQLADYTRKLSTFPESQVSPKPEVSKDGKVALWSVMLKDAPQSNEALDTVKGPLRSLAHGSAPAGTEAMVGGMTSVFVDFQAVMNRDYSVVFPVAAVLIMIVLALLLRSVVAPWYLMASVGLGFAATLGASVLVFQHARGEPGLIFHMPLIMYLFVVALGTDYNILMIARLREEARAGLSPREAAAVAVRHTGPTIGAAGLILVGSFASMMLAGNNVIAEMGFAISLGIGIAAFVMAMFFTPALTALIGHAAWWPGHGDEPKEHVSGGRPDDDLVGASSGADR
ncbi:MAG: MMPL family transporter [Mycobacteriaceae bacterium]|nr:MMPL family transporter [Mycobacteriaceae bacterium]